MCGVEHTVSLFYNDVSKILIVNQMVISHKAIYNLANLYTPFCTDVTSVISLLAIEGHTDKYGERKPVPVTFNIKGAERGK